MIKKISLLFSFLFVLVLAACGNKYSQNISYDVNNFVLQSKEHPYEQVDINTIPDAYMGSGLLGAYLEIISHTGDIENEFRDSLFIFRKNIVGDIDLSELVNSNVKKILSYYEVNSEDERKQMSFVCNNNVIPSELVTFTVVVNKGTEEEKTLYFAEYFYIYTSKVFIISFVSDSETEHNLFVSSIDGLTCK